MALSKTVTTDRGFDAPNAYHRVENVRIESKDKITFSVRSYKEIGLPSFSDSEHSCQYDMSGANPMAQAYAYLKTLPEFADAVDC